MFTFIPKIKINRKVKKHFKFPAEISLAVVTCVRIQNGERFVNNLLSVLNLWIFTCINGLISKSCIYCKL